MDVELFSHGVLLLEQHRTKPRPTAARRQRSSPPPAETRPPSSSPLFERSSSRRSPSQPDLPMALRRIHSWPPRLPLSPEHRAAGRCPLPPTHADRAKEDALQRAPPPGHPAMPARPASTKAISPVPRITQAAGL